MKSNQELYNERFVWKYIKASADVIIEKGAVCDIHCHGNWERDLKM